MGFNPADLASDRLTHGLGLVVLRERLKTVGGSVKIISAPRQGTEIRVSRVPIREGVKMGISVLLADDHLITRDGLRALLEREGFTVVRARPRTDRMLFVSAQELQTRYIRAGSLDATGERP